MAALAEEDLLATLEETIGIHADVFTYTPVGGSPVEIKAIHKPGFIDGIADSRHALLTIMPGARADAADSLHLPNNAAGNTGDTVTIDGSPRRVIEIVRRRGRFTQVSVAN